MREYQKVAPILKRLITCALLLPCSVTSAQNQQQDITNTESLLRMCRSSHDDGNYGFCLGFVSGIADMMEAVGLQGKGDFKKTYGMCVTAPFPSANAEVQAFINWAEKNPKTWEQSNTVGVILSLAATWPCTR